MSLAIDYPSSVGAPRPVRPFRSAIRAFTILEIMVVLAILGLLVGVLMSGLKGSFSSAKVSVARLFVQQTLRASLTRYDIDMGGYPSTQEGLDALIHAPADKADRWQGPYADFPGGKIPLDPFGNAYKYANPGTHNKDGYDLWSMGPDGQDGTADDIGNW
jgi:general secretion pathway protein G